jgi:hypothetical protein
MDFNRSVAVALATAGIVQKSDVDKATEVLADPLARMAAADAAQKAALEDELSLLTERAQTGRQMAVDEKVGDLADEVAQEHKLSEQYEGLLDDEEIIETAEQTISDAYEEAARVLVDAQLVDGAKQSAIAPVISRVWTERHR